MAHALDTLTERDMVVRALQASRGQLVYLLKSRPATAADQKAAVPWWRSARWFLRQWWRKQPLSEALLAADTSGRDLLAPMAARHPWALVGGAVVAGGVLAWAMPRHLQRWVLPLLVVEARRFGASVLAQVLR